MSLAMPLMASLPPPPQMRQCEYCSFKRSFLPLEVMPSHAQDGKAGLCKQASKGLAWLERKVRQVRRVQLPAALMCMAAAERRVKSHVGMRAEAGVG